MIQFAENPDGPLTVFEPPIADMIYTVGVDVSTGLSEDYSVVQVLSNSIPFEQVAVFRAKWAVNLISRMVDLIGRWYNTALIVCEINYPGNSVQDALLQIYQYPRCYQREDHLDDNPGISHHFGFRTTENTKWMLIHELQGAMAEKEVIVHDKNTLYELLNYVYVSGRNKAGAAPGFNDDAVMALMLALHGARLYPMIKKITRSREVITTRDPDARQDWRRFMSRMQRRLENPVPEEIL